MKKLLVYVLLSVCLNSFAQTTNEKVSTYRQIVDAYMTAANKIVKQKDYEGGIADVTAIIDEYEKEKNLSFTQLASYYRLRGQGFFHLKNYSQAESDYRKSIVLLEKAGEAGKADLTSVWYQLSLDYYYWNKPKETIESANKCVETALDYYGPTHSETFDAYILRSNFEGFYNDGPGAMEDRRICFEIIRKNIERNFTYLTSAERTAFWEKYLPETTIMFAFAQKLKEQQSEYTDVLFDQQLLAKGLLLTTESALQRSIDSDPKLSAAYQQIRSLRKTASDINTTPKDAESAILEADRIERELGTTANSLHQFIDFLKIHTDDVKSHLEADDIAIEFVDYRIGKDSTMYAALVMTPKWEHVRFIPLLEKKEIEANKDNLADYIWKPILNCVGAVPKNIYFAPSGLLYTIPIESQTLSDGRLMCEAFNMYRMSSTRWLAYAMRTPSGKDAVIYGGLQYDMSVDDLVADTKKYQNMKRSVDISEDMIDRGIVSSLTYLPGTLEEVKNISNIIHNANIENLSAKLYIGKDGTETSFKAIGGTQIKMLHIATHGFFSSKVSNPMLGSGLYFAGANNKYKRIPIPSETDDGILTAQEISETDLQGLDLVVLSACQTGLGNITADGVQGLQRGFKKAGANSIIMSLWSVDDKATQLLMTTFYREYLMGKSKLIALENAKKVLRNMPEYKDMKYWAAFVLLDSNI